MELKTCDTCGWGRRIPAKRNFPILCHHALPLKDSDPKPHSAISRWATAFHRGNDRVPGAMRKTDGLGCPCWKPKEESK